MAGIIRPPQGGAERPEASLDLARAIEARRGFAGEPRGEDMISYLAEVFRVLEEIASENREDLAEVLRGILLRSADAAGGGGGVNSSEIDERLYALLLPSKEGPQSREDRLRASPRDEG